MKNFSKRFCMGRLVLLPLALALAMILSGCQSVQEKLAGLFDGSGSSSQGTLLGKESDGQGGTAITLPPLPAPSSTRCRKNFALGSTMFPQHTCRAFRHLLQ